MLQVGYIDPLKVGIQFSGGPGVNPTHAGPIGHMVLMSKPKELRVEYIGQVDLIS